MRHAITRFVAAVLALSALAACETVPKRADGCIAGFDTRGAKKLNVRRYEQLNLRITKRSACRTNADGSESTYQVLALPKFSEPYYVQVTSHTIDDELFAPVVVTLDAQGKVSRWIDPDRYVYRSSRLTGEIFFNRANAREKYLAIMSNPRRVGEADRARVQEEQTTYFLVGAWYGARDRTYNVKLTEFGELSVVAREDPSTQR